MLDQIEECSDSGHVSKNQPCIFLCCSHCRKADLYEIVHRTPKGLDERAKHGAKIVQIGFIMRSFEAFRILRKTEYPKLG